MNAILHPDIIGLINTAGYIGILLIIFAESGIFIGFFLPGDTLLFTAGILAAAGHLNIFLVMIVVSIGAILGDQVGYFLGHRYGPKIFNRKESFWFHRKRVDEATAFFEKYGKKTVVFARFVPVIRTFVPVVAGVGKMDYRSFVAYNIIGGIVWGCGISLLGYFLGAIIPNIDYYFLPLLAIIVVVSSIPTVISFLRSRKKENANPELPLSE